jgi:hypothetical protein
MRRAALMILVGIAVATAGHARAENKASDIIGRWCGDTVIREFGAPANYEFTYFQWTITIGLSTSRRDVHTIIRSEGGLRVTWGERGEKDRSRLKVAFFRVNGNTPCRTRATPLIC